MKIFRERKNLFALCALLVVFAACKGESPTAPTPGGGTGGGGGVGGGGTTPPVGATITLSVSNPNPLVNSTTVVTATVTLNGNPVPNGTAVEFGSTIGTWQDSGLPTTIRTTTNGVATATLTSATPGTAQITAVVNNVSQRTSVTFTQAPVTPPPANSTPTITSITPGNGRPEGGETLTITGTNFRTPVRVLFDVGNGVTKEAFVVSVTPTQIVVVTPQVNLGAGQTLDAKVIVLNEAGTPSEQRVQAATVFTFRLAQLTPVISTISPDSGPITGGTRITIFGSGFESPVQVSFAPGSSGGSQGWSQMQVLNVTFDQITAITPAARDVNPTGSGILTGPVDVRVRNIRSNTEVIVPVIFRYTPAMQITGARPLQGAALGGTDVTIDGIGFDPPVDVFIGGVIAQTIRVSGTQIIARTSALAIPCANSTGPISVTNINNGDTAVAPVGFSYIGVNPIITSFTPTTGVVPGSTITVSVQDPGIGPLGNAIIRFGVGGQNVTPTPNQITAGTGIQTFTVVVPTTGFTFPIVACTTASATAGTQLGPINVNLTFTNVTTNCTNTLENGLQITPPGPNTCLQAPTASTSAPPCPAGVAISAVSATGTATGTGTFTVSNAPSSRDLTLSAPTAAAGTNVATVTVVPTTAATVPGGSTTPAYTITVDPTAAGPFSGTVTFTTNDPSKASLQVCFTGTATP